MANNSKVRRAGLLAIVGLLAICGMAYVAESIRSVGFMGRRLTSERSSALESGGAKPSAEPMIRPESINLEDGKELLSELRQGGLVLYFRHFQTDHRKWHEDPIKPNHFEMTVQDFRESCDQQRALTPYGQLRARLCGEAIRDLKIPVGKVYASPYCRTVECAQLLAGREPDDTPKELVHRGGKMTGEMMISNIIPFLSSVPAPGSNTLIVAHRPQMDGIAPIEEGQAFVFRPLGHGKFEMIGALFDTDWIEAQVHPQLFGARFAQYTNSGADMTTAVSR